MITKSLYVLYAGSDLEVPIAKEILQALEVLSVYTFGQNRDIKVDTIFGDVESGDFAIDPDELRAQKAIVVLLFSPTFVLNDVVKDGTIENLIGAGPKDGVLVLPVHTLSVPQRARLPWSDINWICIDPVHQHRKAMLVLPNPIDVAASVADAIADTVQQALH